MGEAERMEELTASGFPTILATVLVASDRMEEVSIPSKLTLVERLRQGIFSSCFLFFSSLALAFFLCLQQQLLKPSAFLWMKIQEERSEDPGESTIITELPCFWKVSFKIILRGFPVTFA